MDDIIIGFIYFKGTPKLLGNHNYFGEKLINILDFYIAYDYTETLLQQTQNESPNF